MNRTHKTLLFGFLLLGIGCSSSDDSGTQNQPAVLPGRQASFGAAYTIPEGWIQEQPSSQMRYAQFRLPGVEGMEAAELTVLTNIAGTVDANLQRWYDQFKQPDGSPTNDTAETKKITAGGLPVTIVYFTGTYLKARAPMMMSGPVDELPGYALIGAILEGPQGLWFFKSTGPQKTVDHWRSSFDEFIQSVQIK